MFSITRNQNSFDREFFDNDMKSMTDFINSVNTYDDRVKLLEDWLVRKEDEIKSRVVRPPPNMKMTDHELHQ